MLVLGRKSGEEVMMRDTSDPDAEDIWIRVWCDEYGGIKLGIKAPDRYKILRKEIVDRERM